MDLSLAELRHGAQQCEGRCLSGVATCLELAASPCALFQLWTDPGGAMGSAAGAPSGLSRGPPEWTNGAPGSLVICDYLLTIQCRETVLVT